MSYYKKSLHAHEEVQTSLLTNVNAKLDTIATNTANINVNVGDVEINVADLEVLQAQTNTTLAAILVDTDAADSSLNTIEAQSVLTASRLNNIQNKIAANVDGTGDTLGQINSNILTKNTEMEASLTSMESKQDSLISANHTDLVALEASLTSMEGKQDSLIAANHTDLVALESSLSSMEGKQDSLISANHTDLVALEASLTSMEGKQDSLISANHTDLVAVEASLTSMEGKQDDIKTLIGTTNSGLSSIDSGISDLDTLLGDIQTDNNSKSDHLSGNLDTLNGKIDTLTTRIKLANSDAHLAVSLEDIGGAATQTTLAAAEAHLGNIETAVQLLDNALDGNYLNVNQNIAGTDVSSNSGNKDAQTQRFCLATDDVPTGLTNTILNAVNGSVGTGNALLTTIDSDTNNIKTAVETLAGAVDGNGAAAIGVRSDVYFAGVASETNSGNKNDNCQRVVLATDDVPLATANAKLVEIESTANSILAKNTEIESTADGILAKNTEMESSLNSILSKNGEIESSMNSLISANHTDLVALENTLTEIAPRQAVSAVYTASTLADDGISSTIDTDDFSFMTICASQNSANLPLEVQYSINDSNWFKVRSKVLTFAAYEGGSWADIVLEHPMRYVRFRNTSGSDITTLHLSYQLSN